MCNGTRPRRRHGLTLVEMLLVMVMVTVLAAILVPRFGSAVRSSKESLLRANLRTLRTALMGFHTDTGAYPGQLEDLLKDRTNPPKTGVNDQGEPLAIMAADFRGPYLFPGSLPGHQAAKNQSKKATARPGLPTNPITGGNEQGIDWIYVKTLPTVGRVYAAVGDSLSGEDYSTF